ncbi:hypothetical protein ACIHFE_13395 [Streptomyces sp. NPDC052396]|uniref:hypothetical protein n=1 Tax=Streptomyces sp. NPDC052396 TaxID=3365689 RepID=UPI0037D92561
MYQHAPQPAPHKQRNWFARHKVLTGIGALVVVVGIGAATGSGGNDEDKTGTSARSADHASGTGDGKAAGKEKEKGKGGKADLSGNGTFQVGSDIKPGTYLSAGNKEGCYWERLKDSTGDADSIIANDNVVGSSYVTVEAGDKVFKTQGCKGWNLVPATRPSTGSRRTEFAGNGMYRVGVDIAPGTYKSQGNKDGCYWERAKDALHGTDSIAANENVTGNGLVTISADDAYFKTSGCTDWKQAG